MSTTIFGAATYGVSTYGILGTTIADAATIRERLDTLTAQSSSGYISTSYAGLGTGAATSLTLRPALAHTQTLQSGIDAATGSMDVAQSALSQISQIASNFFSQTNDLNGLNASDVDTIAASARDALKQVAGLLDSKYGNTYVFAGQDSSNAPVPDPDNILSSGFYTQISAAVSGLGSNGATATIASTLAVASSNASGTSPFSTALSQSAVSLSTLRPIVSAGEGQHVAVGIVASANADVASTGSSTTGSYTRDILRALATLGSLSSSQISDSGFQQLVTDVHSSLGDAITALNADAGVLGNRETQLKDTKTQLTDTATALQTQVSNAEDVDMASTLSNLSLVQTQLQASYQLIAGLQSLSLTKYISSS